MQQWRRTGRAVLAAATIALGASVFAPLAAEARTNHALLVAVTKYPNVRGSDLIGPNNDADLVRKYLTGSSPIEFLPENVQVLADDFEGAIASPTYAAIKENLAALAGRVARGDFVYLQLSGHGIQQPAIDPASEPDGKDETFLPADITEWTDPTKGIPNALPDDEIGAALDAIRRKGAFVWFVMDTCHSGTATRAVGQGDVVDRKIDPALLGIAPQDFAAAQAAAPAGEDDGAGNRSLTVLARSSVDVDIEPADSASGADSLVPGGMVAFFAAQTVEPTPEMLLPRGDPAARKYGLFTHTIFSQLARHPGMSYRQLSQSVMQAYAADGRTAPTPLFEGNLDAPVFGTDEIAADQQWPVKVTPTGMSVPAGRLHRLATGTKLAIMASPAAPLEQALGYVEVRSLDNLTANLVPVAHQGKAAPAPGTLPAQPYARLTEVGFDTELVVALPPASRDFAGEIAQTAAILDAISNDEATPLKLRIVDAARGGEADIRLTVMSEQDVAVLVADAGADTAATSAERQAVSPAPRLWFLPSTGDISLETGYRPPSIGFEGSTPDGLEDEVTDYLVRMFRATNVARLASLSTFNTQEFDVGFKLVRAGTGEEIRLDPGVMPQASPPDQIHLTASNTSGLPVDMNVLYIGSDYSIHHMYVQRLHTGSVVDMPLLEFNPTSYGVERMVVVLTEASALTPLQDLSFLAQVGARNKTRSATHPLGYSGLLRDIADAPATRGVTRIGQTAPAKGALMIFPLRNMPAG